MKQRQASIKFLLVLLVCILLSWCARIERRPPETVQTGMASWYGPGFHGKSTSSKEVFNMYDLTAAHRTLPFGTVVMVTNLENGKSVTVRINDRGPFIKGRIIDLSYAAGRILDMVGPGVIPVKLEILPGYEQITSSQDFSVQVGAFIKKENAKALEKELGREYRDVYITVFKTETQTYYRVRIRAATIGAAEETASRLSREGYAVLILEEQ